jgi:hypothetical protein
MKVTSEKSLALTFCVRPPLSLSLKLLRADRELPEFNIQRKRSRKISAVSL